MTPSPRARRALVILLAGYVAVLAVLLLLPTSEPASRAVEVVRGWLVDGGVSPGLLTAGRAEFVANVAVFVPPLALVMGVWPQVRWQDSVAYGFLASLGVEGAQAVLFAGREATMADVVSNTTGAALGALLGVLVWRGHQRG